MSQFSNASDIKKKSSLRKTYWLGLLLLACPAPLQVYRFVSALRNLHISHMPYSFIMVSIFSIESTFKTGSPPDESNSTSKIKLKSPPQISKVSVGYSVLPIILIISSINLTCCFSRFGKYVFISKKFCPCISLKIITYLP